MMMNANVNNEGPKDKNDEQHVDVYVFIYYLICKL